jgi:hypothetical protein
MQLLNNFFNEKVKLYLSNNVVVGVLQPLVEGDEAIVVLVHVGEVFPTFGKSSLMLI